MPQLEPEALRQTTIPRAPAGDDPDGGNGEQSHENSCVRRTTRHRLSQGCAHSARCALVVWRVLCVARTWCMPCVMSLPRAPSL